MTNSKWFLPLFSVALGAVLGAAQAAGGDPGQGLVSLGIMVVFGAAILFGGRSETVRGLRGDGRDERFRQMDIQASAFAGVAVLIAAIAGMVVQFADGHDGQPFTWLCAIGGVVYMIAIVVLRLRS